MSEAAAVNSEAELSRGGRFALMPLMLAMVAAVLVAVTGVGGVVFWLAKSGRMTLPTAGLTRVEAVAVETSKTHTVALEPLLVNLADGDGRSYLRLAITLKVQDVPLAKGEKPKEEPAKAKPVNEFEAAERDTALGVMGRETSAALLAVDGKDHLKDELKSALKVRVPEAKVVEVLFTEFLVQK